MVSSALGAIHVSLSRLLLACLATHTAPTSRGTSPLARPSSGHVSMALMKRDPSISKSRALSACYLVRHRVRRLTQHLVREVARTSPRKHSFTAALSGVDPTAGGTQATLLAMLTEVRTAATASVVQT